jgi:hypothetical protein
MGYRKIESDSEEVPQGFTVTKESDPYPIEIFGVGTMSDSKIGKYLTSEFYYYVTIYKNTKSFGLPFPGTWLNNPTWVLTLAQLFDDINEEYRKYKKSKGYI